MVSYFISALVSALGGPMPLSITELTSALVGDVHIKMLPCACPFYLAKSVIAGALRNVEYCTSASVEALENHEL